ncbi:cystinosin homolog isoform X2 [Anastrepha ludens]|uniref:cystinosin homolog isoform X2 n=1 Tax=Anastrepha ludens TaxID=28586 RepID=UPI0023B1F00E|nr:cystinosin homolog isoform X2 [Anastrepha ludens]
MAGRRRRSNIGRSTVDARRLRSARDEKSSTEREARRSQMRDRYRAERERESSVERQVRCSRDRDRHTVQRDRESSAEREARLSQLRDRYRVQREGESSRERELRRTRDKDRHRIKRARESSARVTNSWNKLQNINLREELKMRRSIGGYSVKFFTFMLLARACLTQAVAFERSVRAASNTGLTVSTHDLALLVQQNKTFDVLVSDPLELDVSINLVVQHEGLVELYPINFTIIASDPQNQVINVLGVRPGSLEITAKSTPNDSWIADDLFVRVTVANSQAIIYISLVFGWIYFAAWSISFYPQVYINFKRKSVVGLNFDFLALNIVGFALYSVFNCGLYWIPEIQQEYSSRHPRGLNPVMLNDVLFGLHAMFATILSITQCFLYERGDQKVSKTASGILGTYALIVVVSAILVAVDVIHWLDFLYYCSYIKLSITIIKYVPQALMNYRRKSTVGWSIGNILLDFIGGTLSMLQMILNASNYDDWVSIFGDPTKFGLGLFSVLFDVVFMLQHFVFYRRNQMPSVSTLTEATEVPNAKSEEKRY